MMVILGLGLSNLMTLGCHIEMAHTHTVHSTCVDEWLYRHPNVNSW